MRNGEWFHMLNDDIISMPDKWEYPWYAAWDLAFHMLPLAIVDHDFAKQQLDLMLRNDYLPQWAVAGVRVELRRRQPAGARLRDDADLPDGQGVTKVAATSSSSSTRSRSC